MLLLNGRAWWLTVASLALTVCLGSNPIAQADSGQEAVSRHVTFQLTFANRDLIWIGDPASPSTMAHLKQGAQPLATDVQVSTLTTRWESPPRRYMREARIASQDGKPLVYAFTAEREKVIGEVDAQGRFVPNDTYQSSKRLLPTWPEDPAQLIYDRAENALYYESDAPGPTIIERLDFLPLDLVDSAGNRYLGEFSIDYGPSTEADRPSTITLQVESQGKVIDVAKAGVPRSFRRDKVQLGSFDNERGTYWTEAAYRERGTVDPQANLSVTFSVDGEFAAEIESNGSVLVLRNASAAAGSAKRAHITIDGNFDDWRNVAGVDDPRGDGVPYLEYIPDVDLLEFKVAHDNEHLYLYARVAGQVGRSHPDGGRAYFYAYMDVDQNPGTGFLPSRDDDCYYGVDVGDDCEVQFEFVNNALRKTFYGFCGLGGNENVLKQQVTLGKSQYGRLDEQGRERKDYKAEYTFRGGKTEITEDLKLGTSDTISLAISPDGSQVEVVSSLAGFLQDPQGRPTLKVGQTIDVAAGMECDSKLYPGKKHWGADSTPAIRGYRLQSVP